MEFEFDSDGGWTCEAVLPLTFEFSCIFLSYFYSRNTSYIQLMATKLDAPKRGLSPEPGGSNTNNVLGVHTKKNTVDMRLKAITEEFLNNEFDPGVPIDPATRDLMVRFGIEAYKHIAEREAIDSVKLLDNKMNEGFSKVTSKIDFLYEQLNEIVKGKQQEKIKEADLASYADMTKKLATIKPQDEVVEPKKAELEDPKLAKRYTVIELEEKVDDDGFQVVRSKLAKKLMGKQIRVDKIVKTNRGNISLEYPTTADQKKVEQILRDDKPSGASIRSSTVKQVAVALRGIPRYLSEDEVKAHLVDWNGDHPFKFGMTEGWTLKLLQPADGRSRYQLGKIIAPIDRARTLLNNNWRVYVALTALKVELWKPNHTRCVRCLQSGHLVKQCISETVCVICGEDHAKDVCNKKDRMACVVCVKSGKKEFKHMATTKDCPILLAEQMLEYKKVFNYVHHG